MLIRLSLRKLGRAPASSRPLRPSQTSCHGTDTNVTRLPSARAIWAKISLNSQPCSWATVIGSTLAGTRPSRQPWTRLARSSSWTRYCTCRPPQSVGTKRVPRTWTTNRPNIPPRIVAIDQPGSDYECANGLGDAFDFNLGLPIERPAPGKRAQQGNEHHGPDSGLPGGGKEFLRSGHIDPHDVIPAAGSEIIGTVDQRVPTFEPVRVHVLAAPESDGAGPRFGLPRPGGDVPAIALKAALEAASHEAVGTCEYADLGF